MDNNKKIHKYEITDNFIKYELTLLSGEDFIEFNIEELNNQTLLISSYKSSFEFKSVLEKHKDLDLYKTPNDIVEFLVVLISEGKLNLLKTESSIELLFKFEDLIKKEAEISFNVEKIQMDLEKKVACLEKTINILAERMFLLQNENNMLKYNMNLLLSNNSVDQIKGEEEERKGNFKDTEERLRDYSKMNSLIYIEKDDKKENLVDLYKINIVYPPFVCKCDKLKILLDGRLLIVNSLDNESKIFNFYTKDYDMIIPDGGFLLQLDNDCLVYKYGKVYKLYQKSYKLVNTFEFLNSENENKSNEKKNVEKNYYWDKAIYIQLFNRICCVGSQYNDSRIIICIGFWKAEPPYKFLYKICLKYDYFKLDYQWFKINESAIKKRKIECLSISEKNLLIIPVMTPLKKKVKEGLFSTKEIIEETFGLNIINVFTYQTIENSQYIIDSYPYKMMEMNNDCILIFGKKGIVEYNYKTFQIERKFDNEDLVFNDFVILRNDYVYGVSFYKLVQLNIKINNFKFDIQKNDVGVGKDKIIKRVKNLNQKVKNIIAINDFYLVRNTDDSIEILKY